MVEKGFDAYIDVHDINPGWQERLGTLIADAEKIVFLVSPSSVASEFCAWEVDHAERLGKSIFPIVIHETERDEIPGRLSRLNFVFVKSEGQRANELPTLVKVLLTPSVYRSHRRSG